MALTSTGLIIPKYAEILESLVSLEKSEISPSVDTADDKFFGQLNKVIALTLNDMYELMELVHNATNINAAYGSQLDAIGLIKNIRRLEASSTNGYQVFSGDINASITAGTIVENSATSDRYSTQVDYSITPTSLVGFIAAVDTITDSFDYTIVIDSDVYTITSGVSATANSIVSALKAEIDLNPSSGVTTTVVGDTLVVVSDTYSSFSVTTSAELSLSEGSTLGYVYADEEGGLIGSAGAITKIVTPILGINSTTNPFNFTPGSLRETDASYRARLLSPVSIGGKATIPAIRAGVSNVPGVSYVNVVHNPTEATVGVLPPNSVHVVVQGGVDADIAETVFDYVGGGIQTYGTTTEVVVDQGQSHSVSFSRPTPLYVAIRITYASYGEESLTASVESVMREAVLDHINALGIDVDVIPGRMFKPIYDNTSGIGDITVEVQTIASPGDTPSGAWSSSTLVVSDEGYAVSTAADVTFVAV